MLLFYLVITWSVCTRGSEHMKYRHYMVCLHTRLRAYEVSTLHGLSAHAAQSNMKYRHYMVCLHTWLRAQSDMKYRHADMHTLACSAVHEVAWLKWTWHHCSCSGEGGITFMPTTLTMTFHIQTWPHHSEHVLCPHIKNKPSRSQLWHCLCIRLIIIIIMIITIKC